MKSSRMQQELSAFLGFSSFTIKLESSLRQTQQEDAPQGRYELFLAYILTPRQIMGKINLVQ